MNDPFSGGFLNVEGATITPTDFDLDPVGIDLFSDGFSTLIKRENIKKLIVCQDKLLAIMTRGKCNSSVTRHVSCVVVLESNRRRECKNPLERWCVLKTADVGLGKALIKDSLYRHLVVQFDDKIPALHKKLHDAATTHNRLSWETNGAFLPWAFFSLLPDDGVRIYHPAGHTDVQKKELEEVHFIFGPGKTGHEVGSFHLKKTFIAFGSTHNFGDFIDPWAHFLADYKAGKAKPNLSSHHRGNYL